LHVGLFNSVEFRSFPHLSHWSPRAESYSHPGVGQVPSTRRLAKNLSHVSK